MNILTIPWQEVTAEHVELPQLQHNREIIKLGGINQVSDFKDVEKAVGRALLRYYYPLSQLEDDSIDKQTEEMHHNPRNKFVEDKIHDVKNQELFAVINKKVRSTNNPMYGIKDDRQVPCVRIHAIQAVEKYYGPSYDVVDLKVFTTERKQGVIRLCREIGSLVNYSSLEHTKVLEP